jgi:concentrative nucleoside transporter, CNT family
MMRSSARLVLAVFASAILTFVIAAPPAAAQPADTVTAPDRLAPEAPPAAQRGQDALPPPATGVGAAAPPIEPPQTRIADARRDLETPFSARAVSLLGMIVLLGIAWLLSTNRSAIPWRIVAWGIGLQVTFAVLILKTTAGVAIFAAVNDVIIALLGFTVEGAQFLFGNLVWNHVPVGTGEPGNAPMMPAPGSVAQTGAFFAFNVLPTIVFFSSLMTVLYYFGIMQRVVRGVAWVMMRTMRTSGAETLSAAGNIFLGQTEAPLLVKPFVARMTRSELMAVMTGGFATVAGGVMAAFVGMLVFYVPDIAGHLLAASVMSAPAALVFAKIMVPESELPETTGRLTLEIERPDANVIDAAARGAGEGLSLAFNVGAMLLAFIALIALVNSLLGLIGEWTGLTPLLQQWNWLALDQRLNLESILGWIFAPLAWVMGVPWQDASIVGGLLGIKTAVNEFVGYLRLSALLGEGSPLAPRSIIIATYALCGFANFSSIAIQIGGLGGIAPGRRSDLARLGLRAMIGGTLAAFMTATVAGMII